MGGTTKYIQKKYLKKKVLSDISINFDRNREHEQFINIWPLEFSFEWYITFTFIGYI